MELCCDSCQWDGYAEELEQEACPECGMIGDVRRAWPVYVNVYLVDKCYGGPEEGGWYYMGGEPIASVPANTPEERDKLKLDFEERFSNRGRRPIDSVLSEGEYRIYVEHHFAHSFPNHRPHYE